MANIDIPIIQNNMIKEAAKVSIWHQLLSMANAKGFKKGWAAHQFMEIFGDYPKGIPDGIEPVTPSMRAWFRAKAEEWHESQHDRIPKGEKSDEGSQA